MTNYEIQTSIIIPTFNRIELLEFTLLSLSNQSIPASHYEVIVVNDCSNDQTKEFLTKFNAPYKLIVLHNKVNQGAAFSRNRGIKLARGKIIIFLDEMLVARDFIEKHLNYHLDEKMVVTTHWNGEKIFSHYYTNFTRKQKRIFKKTGQKYNAQDKFISKKGVYRLLDPEKIINQNFIRYSFRAKVISKWYRALEKTYGKNLEKMAAPWFIFVTNGVSLSRKLLDEAEHFDENFPGAWMEDWELGYRLYQKGALFDNAFEIACIHQNHPIGRDTREILLNCRYFAQKHPVIEVFLIPSISVLYKWTVDKLGKILTQYRELEKNPKSSYTELILAFRDLAKIFQLHMEEMIKERAAPLLETYQQGFLRWEPSLAEKIQEQLEHLEEEDKNQEFIAGFQDLLRLPLYEEGLF